MIGDHDQLSLRSAVDDSVAKAEVSVSLGLIVTELVINALKHAFPRHRQRQHPGRLSLGRAGLDAVGARHRRRHAGGLPTPSRASAPASSRRWRGNWARPSEIDAADPGTMVSIVHA